MFWYPIVAVSQPSFVPITERYEATVGLDALQRFEELVERHRLLMRRAAKASAL